MDYEFTWYCDNQTNDTLCVYLAFGNQTPYPDTTLPIDPDKVYIAGVDPYKKQVIYVTGVKYENMVKDTLSVFFFHQDTLQKYKWQEIKDKYKILKRYDLSLNDLQNLSFSIPYPPDETMKNIKMYPPYKE